ncbi:putative phosphomutase (TIGR03848 family) [Haloactinopolyspora alba]|uniref:Putative phosphomutase (TIGR03848 family) n=1 Tax=Haloactinopolyspora alba TaxID=648780 RepID=A0A2P8D9C1_9ACTN|nr:MSMEG_4193 family putative phosphomutase [Haloactinopolyspora alba]PSK93815.1 putative phosphomutase (TIGR03848 family) [Haloactinopolyspora alba]
MPTVVLVRHGRTAANASGTLAGRTPGVGVDEAGLSDVHDLAGRLRGIRPAAVVSSPLERCVQTARVLTGDDAAISTDERLTECDYGSWTGRALSELRRQKLWRVVQEHPSGAVFPDGEAMRDVQDRAVAAVREHDARVAESAGPSAVWFAVSHGDVIKSVVADALGMHLDHFQRIVVDPCSLTAITYTDRRPFVVRVNDVGGDLGFLRAAGRRRRRGASADGAVGGGRGSRAR